MNSGERDKYLLRRIKEGDEEALGELIEKYDDVLRAAIWRRCASPADMDDVLQETWIRVSRSAAAFSEERGPLAGWLIRIALNRARTLLKYRLSRCEISFAELEAEARDPLDWEAPDDDAAQVGPAELACGEIAEERLMAAEREAAVRQKIDRLPPLYRGPLTLRYYEGYSEPEIARLLGVPLGTLKSIIHRGLRLLKIRMGVWTW